MIIPGLDRLEGTAVNPELLNSDDLWHEHTTEILELFEQENNGKSPEDCVSMMQFCSDFATGVRTTLAIRRAKAKQEWKIEPLAVRLAEEDQKAKKPVVVEKINEQGSNRRSRNRDKAALRIARSGTKKRLAPVPGIVLAAGAAYPYREENSKIRGALKRLRDLLKIEGFYCTPEHACHVTIATLQKFRADENDLMPKKLLDIESISTKLRQSERIEEEFRKGPITLIADCLDIPGDGDSVILLFKDKENRFDAIRQALAVEFGADDLPDLRIPSFVHCSLGRVASYPSCSRAVMLQKVQGIVEDIEVTIDTVDLFLEDREPYFALFPEGTVAHWDLRMPVAPDAKPSVEDATTEQVPTPFPVPPSFASFLLGDEAVVVSIALMAFSVAAIIWR